MRINNIYTYQNINKDLYKKQKNQAVNYTPAFKSLAPFASVTITGQSEVSFK